MSNFGFFNADDFKRWMKKNSDFDSKMEQKTMVGLQVETMLSAKRFAKKIICENGNAIKISKEFVKEGGIIKEIDGNDYLIEVKSGSFQVNKKYVVL